MSAFEYAFEASTEGELAEAPDLYIDVDVHRCRPESRRRASFRYSLRIMDKTKDAIVREKGTLQVTRRRATFEPSSPGAPALSTRLLADASW